MNTLRHAGLAILGLATASLAHADDALGPLLDQLQKQKGSAEAKQLLEALVVDMPMTTSPATFVLGASDMAVPRVSTFRTFASTVSRAIGKDGKPTTSMAVEVVPYLAMRDVSWSDFDSHFLTRALARTAVSAATVAGGSDEAAQSAVGLQTTLYASATDAAVKAAASAVCTSVKDAFLKRFDAGDKVTLGGPEVGKLPELPADSAAQVAACRQLLDAAFTKWNQSIVSIGLGQGFYSAAGKATSLHRATSVGWITAAYGDDFGGQKPGASAGERNGWLVTAHLRRSVGERVADPADATRQLQESATLGGLNLRAGNRRLGWVAELSARRAATETLGRETVRRRLIGIDYRIMPDLYVSIGAGSEGGRRDGKSPGFGTLNLKWGFGDKPIIAP